MWEYKVVTGHYSIDGANVFVKNPAGEGMLQQILDHYGNDRWELIDQHLDGVHREVVLTFKRPKGGVAVAPVMPGAVVMPVPMPAPAYAAAPAAAPARGAGTFVDADGEVVRRRTPGSPPAGAPPAAAPAARGRPGGTMPGRRSKADLDKLARED